MCYSHVLCYSSQMKLHPDCVIRRSLIQHLDSKNTLKIRWQWALLSHPHLVIQVCDDLLCYGRWECINSCQDCPLTSSVSCTSRSLPRCMFWMQEPYLTQVMLLSCSRIPYSLISQSNCRSKRPEQPPRVLSAVWQLRSTGRLLSCDTLCRHASVMWRGVWALQTCEKSMFSF